jgi:hypothetical protein
MNVIITEEMQYHQRLCEYALKNGVSKAARRYHTYRQFVYRQLEKYDGDVRSLALKSRKPHRSPNAHTKGELGLIKECLRETGSEVYVRCKIRGYSRSFGSMCRQIRKRGYRKPAIHKKSYTRYTKLDGKYPGDKVQIDIKYVPSDYIRFPTYGDKYYQITAIDEFNRKRVLKVVKEKSTYETAQYLRALEEKIGFPIRTVQVDNGKEFINDSDVTGKESVFETAAKELGMKLKRIRHIRHGRMEKLREATEKTIKYCISGRFSLARKNLKPKWPNMREDTTKQLRPHWTLNPQIKL